MALAIVVSNLVVAVVVVQSVVGAVAAVGFVAVGSVGFDFAAAVVVVGVECFGAAMRSYLWLLRLARPQSLAKSRPQLPVDSIGLFGELLGWPLRRRVIEHRLGFERSSRLVLDRISLRLKVLEIYAHQSISERASDLKLLSSRHLPGASHLPSAESLDVVPSSLLVTTALNPPASATYSTRLSRPSSPLNV